MIWVVQENLWSEPEYRKFLKIIDKSGIRYETTTVVPFSHELRPDIESTEKVIAYGSTTLMKIALSKKWNPGCYYNEKFDVRYWNKGYKHYSLNHDATICKFKDVKTDLKDFFIRPCEDLKQFTGEVIQHDKFKDWQDRILNMDSEQL